MRLTNLSFLVRLYNWWHGSRVVRQGPGHRLRSSNARLRGTRIEFSGCEGEIVLGRDVRLFDCTITLRGTAPRLIIGAETRLRGVRIVVEDRGSRLHIGASTSMTGAILQAKEGGLVEFGTDCMVGGGAEISNSDSHSLTDAADGSRLNPARDIVIGDHGWLGSGAWVSKGSRIGSGSVIAARSRVVGEVPSNVLAAGSPASIKRTGVSWSRERLGVDS
jgi:acetyltransferase-like isoleucine patch superfamily enzyme